MGRLTEYLSPQRSTRRRHYIDVDSMPVPPGPLQPGWSPIGRSRREVAAAKATQLLMQMKREGQTPQLARRFDTQCRILDPTDGGDLGSILRGGIFNDGTASDPCPVIPTRAELLGTYIELTLSCHHPPSQIAHADRHR